MSLKRYHRGSALTTGATGVLLVLCLAAVGRAEQPAAPTHAAPTQPHVSAAPAVEAGTTGPASDDFVSQVPRDQFADLWFSNRLIITFRARIVPRDPEARAEGAERTLSRLADSGVTGPVASRALRSASVVTVAGRDVFGSSPPMSKWLVTKTSVS